MKQNYFEDLDTGWEDLISDIYNNSKYFKPEYEIIDGKKYISKQYTNEDIGDEKELLLDHDLYIIDNLCFYNCTNLIGTLNIPDSVKQIDELAFNECTGFTSLKLSKNLISIGSEAFGYCTGFTSELVIPDSVEILDNSCFENCTGFTSLKLSKNLKAINSCVFESCTGLIGELVIPETVEYIDICAFRGCNFSKIYVPKQYINDYNTYWNEGCNAEIIEY